MHRICCKICAEAPISSVRAAEDLGLCLHGFFLHASRAEGHLDLPLLASGGVNIFLQLEILSQGTTHSSS